MRVLARRSVLAIAVVGVVLALAWGAGRLTIDAREDAELPEDPPSGVYLDLDGHRSHTVTRGSGPPILLLHGLGASSMDWEESVLPALARSRRVVAIDYYGMGLSERSASFAYGWELWSEQAVATLDALGIERADVVGHSLGGTVGAFLAARHPERVRRLVLVGSAEWVPWYFVAWLTPGVGELLLGSSAAWGVQPRFSEAHRARVRRAYRVRGTRQALLRYTRGSPFAAAGLSAAFASLRLPILQLHGTRDGEVPHWTAVRLHDRLPSSQLVSVEDGSHYLMLDAPDCFVDELSRFLGAPLPASLPVAERRRTRRCSGSRHRRGTLERHPGGLVMGHQAGSLPSIEFQDRSRWVTAHRVMIMAILAFAVVSSALRGNVDPTLGLLVGMLVVLGIQWRHERPVLTLAPDRLVQQRWPFPDRELRYGRIRAWRARRSGIVFRLTEGRVTYFDLGFLPPADRARVAEFLREQRIGTPDAEEIRGYHVAWLRGRQIVGFWIVMLAVVVAVAKLLTLLPD